MQLVRVLSIAISMLMSATVLNAETPLMKELPNRIKAFLCETEKYSHKNHLIFFQSENGWTINGLTEWPVTKNEKGFIINVNLFDYEGVVTLSENQNGSWKLVTPQPQSESEEWDCRLEDDFVTSLIEIIYPHIFEITTSLSFQEYKEFIAANNISNSQNIDLDKNTNEIKQLNDDLTQTETKTHKNNEVGNIIRNKMRLCWNPPVGVENGLTNVMILGVKLDIDGKLMERPVNLTPNSEVGSLKAFEAASKALIRCSPFNDLDPEMYESWKEITIKFDPRNLGR